jgi:hypothetical protein
LKVTNMFNGNEGGKSCWCDKEPQLLNKEEYYQN